MKTKLITTIMLTLFLVSITIFAIPNVHASPVEIHVPADYSTIQAAVDAANPGDTILVEAGNYEENVNVYKSVTIDGQGVATLIAGVEYWTGKRGDGFRVTASDVIITGFTIIGHYGGINQDFNNPGVMIGGNFPGDIAHLGVQRVTVSNNIFRDSWSAIYIWKSSNNLITGNKIYNMDWRAIQVYDGSSDTQIQQGHPSQNNKIIDNEIANGKFGGIFIGAWITPLGTEKLWTDNTGTKVIRNYIHDTLDIGIGTGFSFGAKEFSGNIIDSCGKGIRIMGDGATDTYIHDNEISRTDYGILLLSTTTPPPPVMDCANTTISGNTISHSTIAGIGVMYATGPITVSDGNSIMGNKIGIQVINSAGIAAHWNNIFDNTEYGVWADTFTDAEYNWWGDPSGPYDPSDADGAGLYNPDGLGDEVNDYVDYEPWLKAPFQLYDLKDEIEGLPNGAFKNPKAAEGQREALLNKIDAVISQVEAGAYTGAINKLEKDVKDKIEKWIVDPYKAPLIAKVSLIISILESL